VQNIDYAETFLDIAGVTAPDDMQGQSIVPLLKGATPDDWRNSLYYHYYEFPAYWHAVRRHEGVSTDRYKLIRFYGNDVPNSEEWEFYDLEVDPNELTSVYGQETYASEVTALKTELLRLREVYHVPDDVGGLPVKPMR